MNSRAADQRVRDLLDSDPDEVSKGVHGLPYGDRSAILSRLLILLAAPDASTAEKERSAFVAREMLAGYEPVLSEQHAMDALITVADLLKREKHPGLQKALLALCGVLSTRVPLSADHVLGAVAEAYTVASSSSDKDVGEFASRMAKRLTAKRAVLPAGSIRTTRVLTGREKAFADVDIALAVRNVRIDATKDWLDDPWGWPELDWLATNPGCKAVEHRLKTNTTGYVVRLDVAKDSRSTRPALVMDPADRVAYQALIDKVSLELVGHLPSWVYGWRLRRDRPQPGIYADNRAEWRRYTADLADKRKKFRYAAHFDIRSFFATVPPDSLLRQLLRQCHRFERLEQFLHSWNPAASRTGLPQRFLPSSLLAQAYLRPLDEYLVRTSGGSNQDRMGILRWMDDIWLFSNTEYELDRCNKDLDAILEQIGLAFNSEKTRRFDAKQTPDFLQLVNTSGDEDDDTPLRSRTPADMDRQIDQLLNQAEEAPRPNISFFVSYMVATKSYGSLGRLESMLDELPHVADLVARLLRSSGRWTSHEAWYLKYLDQHFSHTDWSVEAWGGMFPPRTTSPPPRLTAAFADKILSSLQTTVVPLVCSLLSSWRPDLARSVFPNASSLSKPFEFRGLALAGLSCGIDRNLVSEWLGAFPESHYVVDFLRSRNFKPLGLSDDDATFKQGDSDATNGK
jgi:hypothetical protein